MPPEKPRVRSSRSASAGAPGRQTTSRRPGPSCLAGGMTVYRTAAGRADRRLRRRSQPGGDRTGAGPLPSTEQTFRASMSLPSGLIPWHWAVFRFRSRQGRLSGRSTKFAAYQPGRKTVQEPKRPFPARRIVPPLLALVRTAIDAAYHAFRNDARPRDNLFMNAGLLYARRKRETPPSCPGGMRTMMDGRASVSDPVFICRDDGDLQLPSRESDRFPTAGNAPGALLTSWSSVAIAVARGKGRMGRTS